MSINTAPTFATPDGGGVYIFSVPSTALTFDGAYRVILGTGGRLIVAGSFSGTADNGGLVLELTSAGLPDTSFSGDGWAVVADGADPVTLRAAVLQPDGKIIVAGNGNTQPSVQRLNADGTLDLTFGTNGVAAALPLGTTEVYSVALQADGKIVVAGTSRTTLSGQGSYYDFLLYRYNANGTLDTTFNGDGNNDGVIVTPIGSTTDIAYEVTVLSSGKILAVGKAGSTGQLVMYQSNGAIDTTWGSSGFASVAGSITGLAVQSDGKFVVTGYTGTSIAVFRLNANGTVDTSFDGDGQVSLMVGQYMDIANKVTVQTDGKILVAGLSYYVNGWSNHAVLVRLNANGSLDTGFGTGGIVSTPFETYSDDAFNDVVVQADGKIVVTGYRGQSPGSGGFDANYDVAVVRYNSDGTLDTSFGQGTVSDIVGYQANQTPVVLAPSANIYDANLAALASGTGNYGGATLTISRHGGANAQDFFWLSGVLTNSGSNLLLNGNFAGTFTNSGGTFAVTFANGITQTEINSLLKLIKYSNSAAASSGGSVIQIDLVFSDGNSGAQGTGGAATATGQTFIVMPATSITGSAGSNNIAGTINSDTITASGGNDTVDGDTGNDSISGGAGNDSLLGGGGNDTLDGGADNDTLAGGAGTDSLTGGSGSDRFNLALGSTDTITDFTAGAGGDVIDPIVFNITSLTNYTNGQDPFATGHLRLTQSGSNTLVEVDPDGSSAGSGFQTVAILANVNASSIVASNIVGGWAPNHAPTFATPSGGGAYVSGSLVTTDSGARVLFDASGQLYVVGNVGNGGDRGTLSGVNFAGIPATDALVMRFTSAGTPDVGYSGDGIATGAIGPQFATGAAAIQTDGKMVVVGSAWKSGQLTSVGVLRFNTNGTLDTTFDSDGAVTTVVASLDDNARAVAVQSDGKILVAGSTRTTTFGSGSFRDILLLRYNADGSLDSSFNGDGNSDGVIVTSLGSNADTARGLQLLTGGSFIVTSTTSDSNGLTLGATLVKYLSNGAIDTSWGTSGKVSLPLTTGSGSVQSVVQGITQQSDGKLLVTGWEDRGLGDGSTNIVVFRLNADGTADTSFDGDGKVSIALGRYYDIAYKAVVQTDGKIVLGGLSFYSTLANHGIVVRLNSNGSLDTGFGQGGVAYSPFQNPTDDGYNDIALQSDGHILASGFRGTLTQGFGGYHLDVVRYNSDGSLDTSFGQNPSGSIVAYDPGFGPVALAPTFSIYDTDLAVLAGGAGDYGGATLSIARHGGANAQDSFSVSGALAFSNPLAPSSGNLLLNGNNAGSFTNSGGTFSVTFAAGLDQAKVNQLVKLITFSSTTAFGSPGSTITLDLNLSDGNTGSQGTGGTGTTTGQAFLMIPYATQTGSAAGDSLTGTSFSDTITGGAGNDTITGLDGSDSITGGDGNDSLVGGAGFDTLVAGSGNDTMTGGADSDMFVGALGVVTTITDFQTGAGSDVFEADLSLQNITNGANPFATGHLRFVQSGSDALLQVDIDGPGGPSGYQTLFVLKNKAYDSFTSAAFEGFADPAGQFGTGILGTGANDNLLGTSGADTLQGLGGDDFIQAAGGGDSLSGGSGNDTLFGQDGDDTLDGGTGDDSIDGGPMDDLLQSGAGNDTYQGQGGADTLSYDNSPAGVVVTKPQNGTTNGTASDGFGGTDVIGQGTADELVGSAFNDILTGSPTYTAPWGEVFGDDWISGGAGNDQLFGLSGDDELEGGLGNDTIDGGAGDDVAVYENASGAVNVNLQTGIATGADGTDTLISIEMVSGSNFNDVLTGSSGANSIAGGTGNDTIDGAGGRDTVFYSWASGPITVNLTTGTVTGADGNDTLSNIEGVHGSAYSDSIVGSAGADELVGNRGNDTFVGGAGNDTINGGTTGEDDSGIVGSTDNEAYDIDTATFTGNRADYTLSYDSSTGLLTVTDKVAGRDGVDTLFSIERLKFADQILAQPGSAGHLDPSQTYLSTSVNDPTSLPEFVSLADLGLAPGDIVSLTSLGAWVAGAAFSDTATGVLAVFSNGTSYIAPVVYSQSVTRPQANTNTPTDIPQDFFIPTGGTTLVQIPVGATLVVFSAFDSFFSDNYDPNHDYQIVGRKLDAATQFAGNDQMWGTAGDDTLLGGTGRDTFLGGAGDDLLDGGTITDRINYTDRNVLTYATSPGAVSINLSGISGDGSIGRGSVSDGFGGTDKVANVDFIVASPFADTILGSTAAIFEEFNPLGGNDTVDGGAIDPVLQNNANRISYVNANGAVTVNLTTGFGGGADQGTDTLLNINHATGSSFNDTLTGSDASWTEQFQGGAGNDTIDGKGGIDIVRYDSATVGVNVNLVTGVAQDGQGGTDALSNIEGIRGSNFGDVLTGGNPANGSGTSDGFESFLGQAGNDTITGGAGYDRIDFSTSTAGVVVDLGTGSAQDGLGGTDTFTGIEAIRGSDFNDVLTGTDGAPFESFEGRVGSDTIDGKGGTDRIDYQFHDRAVTIDLVLGTAIDAHSQFALAWDVDTFMNIEDVRGSNYADSISGNASANRINPMGGDDTVEGLAGNDYYFGSSGVDTLTYTHSAAGVTVLLSTNGIDPGTANDGFGGVDTIEAGAADRLIGSGFADVLTGSDLYTVGTSQFGIDEIHGGAGNDSITGNAGNDQLWGDAGDDTLLGGGDDDELHGGAGNDDLRGGNGKDTAYYDDAASGVGVNLLTGASSGGGGVDHLSSIEIVIGSNFADTLTGGTEDATLVGGLGNDTIVGGTGANLAGYMFASASVTVNLATGTASGADGNDTLTGVLNVVGSKFDDVLVGSAAGNLLLGGDGNDSLSGGAGNDTLVGGLGNDTLDGGTGNDIALFTHEFNDYSISTTSTPGELVVSGPDGRDVVRNVELLQFDDRSLPMLVGTVLADVITANASAGPVIIDGGDGDDVLTANNSGDALLGGQGNDSLRGGDGSDNLDGGTGNDTMSGGAGDDVYVVDSLGDVVIEPANALVAEDPPNGGPLTVVLGGGVDKVVASINYAIGNFVENLALATAAGNLNGIGNSLANVITGNEGNNSLNGMSGDDSIAAGDGADTLVGGAGNDTLDGGNGRDVVHFSGKVNDYALTFGSDGIRATGPEGTDLLVNVERLEFDQVNSIGEHYFIAFDVTGNGGVAYRLYQSAFDRAPDIGGLGFQINAMDIGFGITDLAANFIESPEFQTKYGNLTNVQFVTRLYNNVLHRDPDQGGLDFHVHNLELGLPRNYLLAQFSESPENQANVIGVIATGMVYTH